MTNFRINELSFFILFIFITISNSVISIESYNLIKVVRIFLAISLLLIFSFQLFKGGLDFKVFIFFSPFILSFLIYFLIRLDDSYFFFFIDLVIILVASIVFFKYIKYFDSFTYVRLCYFSAFYFIFLVSIILYTDSIVFGVPPYLNFSYGSTLIGREETYSLGVSNIYGLLSLIFVHFTIYNKKNKVLFFTLFLLAFSICALGGGRGEFAATLLLSGYIFFIFKANFLRYLVFLLFAPLLFLFDYSFLFEHIELFNRFLELNSGGLSSRDYLFLSGIDLLNNSPFCLLFGCGAGYFQYYNNYPLGLYPHNSILEFVISYGLPFVFLFAFFIVRGIYIYSRCDNSKIFVFIFLYAFIVSLKSGYFLGSWMLVGLCIAFASLNTIKIRGSKDV